MAQPTVSANLTARNPLPAGSITGRNGVLQAKAGLPKQVQSKDDVKLPGLKKIKATCQVAFFMVE
jgi:hypothetical protein